MTNTLILEDLSEEKMDKVIVNDSMKAGWELVISNCESWFFTFTNEDNSSKTSQCYASC